MRFPKGDWSWSHSRDSLRAQSYIVDTDVVDQASEETCCIKGFASADVQAAGRGFQRGSNTHCINYRHVIDWLVRKPGAFENYRCKDDLFPTSRFRIAYDLLCSEHGSKRGNKHYLKIRKLAAHESQTLTAN